MYKRQLHERVAGLAGHARLHPLQDPQRAQGALELMWNLERALAEIAGLPYVSLQPSAGSHGELAGVLLTRAYHEDRGDPRRTVLTPDTAHGTNPATVTMAGYDVVKVGTNADGGVDLDDLRAKADKDTACLMLTNPNTLGPVSYTHLDVYKRQTHDVEIRNRAEEGDLVLDRRVAGGELAQLGIDLGFAEALRQIEWRRTPDRCGDAGEQLVDACHPDRFQHRAAVGVGDRGVARHSSSVAT